MPRATSSVKRAVRRSESAGAADEPNQIVVVTGGAGFLGARIVGQLCLHQNLDAIRVFDLKPWKPELSVDPVTNSGRVSTHIGDVTDADAVSAAIAGATVVYHCAGMVDWGQGDPALVTAVNVEGTRNVVKACIKHGVKRLVYTSSMDVVMWNNRGIVDAADSDCEVPEDPDDFMHGTYASSKARAEELVQKASADQENVLSAVIVRPTGLYGERDPYHIPNVLRSAAAGMLLFRIGHPGLRFTHCYVANTAHAHVCAAEALESNPSVVAGEAYIITEGPSHNFWDLVEPFVADAGYWMPPPWLYLPGAVAMLVAHITMFLAWLLSPFVNWRPQMTPATLQSLVYSKSFDGRKAREELGYCPLVDPATAVAQSVAWFARERGNRS